MRDRVVFDGDAENAEHENARHENVAPNDTK